MNLLAIDTATEACSVALQVGNDVFNRFEVCPQGHSQRLLPMVDEVLKEANTSLKQLDYLVFGRGPGSFTGVRIATGMLQGLALGTDLPVVGVSTLAAMAQQAISEAQVESVCAAIDARMSEVYFARFVNHEGRAVLEGEEQVMPPHEAVAHLPESTFVSVGTGWDAYDSLKNDSPSRQSSTILYPDAAFMLPLAMYQIAQGDVQSVDTIEPVYLRDKVTWKKLPGR